MGMTMTQKILAAHAGLPSVEAGQLIGDLTAAENFACEKNVIQKKYDKLCEEFEELQENYNDLFDDYYEV